MENNNSRPTTVPAEAVWNANDNEWELGSKKNGKPSGNWKWWLAPIGYLVCETNFDDEGNIMNYTRFHPDGSISRKGTYKDGREHGITTYFKCNVNTTEYFTIPRPDPAIWKAELTFEQGTIVGENYFSKDGERVDYKYYTSPRIRLSPLSLGFHKVKLAKADQSAFLRSSDEWEILSGVLIACQSGDFSELDRIPKLLRLNDSFLFWKAAMELVGFAGSWRFIQHLFNGYAEQVHDGGNQYFLSIALGNSSGLWAVEPLLTLHDAAIKEEPRYQIEGELSFLLEEDTGPIFAGADETTAVSDDDEMEVSTAIDFEGYAKDVRNARDEIIKSIGSNELPVFEATILDINATARKLYQRLTSGEDNSWGRLYREQMLFEASTGVDCSGFYDKEHRLQPLAAAAIMESFLESDQGGRFQPGCRYFFGHLIEN